MPSPSRLALAVALLSLGTSARAAVNLEATRLTFTRTDGTYSADETAELVLSHRSTGTATTVRDLMVQVEIRTSPSKRQRFRLRELAVPQGAREFRMPLALSGIPAGTHAIIAWLDSENAVAETDEDDNTARASLVIRSAPPAGSSSGSSAPGGTSPPAGAGRAARSSRVVSATTCSALEREWSSPLEVGYHPGHGSSTVTMTFDVPAGSARNGDLQDAILHLSTASDGAPFDELGALSALVRVRGARCGDETPQRASIRRFSGHATVDLESAIEASPGFDAGCAERVDVTLGFDGADAETGASAHLLRIDPVGTTLELVAGR